jgi:hypothetical protein
MLHQVVRVTTTGVLYANLKLNSGYKLTRRNKRTIKFTVNLYE